MRLLVISKGLRYLVICITLNMLSGCNFINVYSEIKKDPIVLDVEIYQLENKVTCRVILEVETYLENPEIKANQFRELIQEEFKDANIVIRLEQEGKASLIY